MILQEIYTAGKSYDGKSRISLPAGTKGVSLNLWAIYPPDPGKIRYSYRWEDDAAWVSNGAEDILHISGLGPGNSSLKLRATVDGLDISDEITFNIHVKRSAMENYWIAIPGVLLLMLFLAGLSQWNLGMKNKALKEKSARLQDRIDLEDQKQRVGQLRLNPHFIFNALNSISGLISVGEYSRARQSISDFARIMRMTLDAGEQDFIPLEKELEFIEKYIRLEQMCRMDKFDYEIRNEAGGGLEVPPLLIQPLVENAIIHGIAKSGGHGKLEVGITREADHLLVGVRDNGPGIKNPGVPEHGSTSSGTRIVVERIRLVHKWIGENILRYRNITTGEGESKGTEALLKIPYRKINGR